MAKRFIRVPQKLHEEVLMFFNSLFAGEDNSDNFQPPAQREQRGRLAKAIDFIFLRLIIFIVSGWFFSRYTSVELAVPFAAVFTMLVHIFLMKTNLKRNKVSRQKMEQYIAKAHTYDQIMKMDPSKEFKIFITQVLNSLEGFSGMQPNDSSVTKNQIIDVTGKFKDRKIGITCRQYDQETEVGKADIEIFVKELKEAKLNRGIFLTTSEFSDWAIDYVQSIKQEIPVVLVDKSKVVEWVRLSKHGIYPDTSQVAELKQKKQEQEQMESLKRKHAKNKNLMRSFFLVTVYLTVLGFIMQRWLADWLLILYFGIAVVNLALGLIFYYMYLYTKELIGEVSMLDSLD